MIKQFNCNTMKGLKDTPKRLPTFLEYRMLTVEGSAQKQDKHLHCAFIMHYLAKLLPLAK